MFKMKHSSSKSIIRFANRPCWASAKNSRQAEKCGLNRTSI